MKKIYTLLLLSLMFYSSHAQIATSLGFKGGVAFSKFNGESVSDAETNAGPTIGGFANLGFANFADFQIEALYTQIGGRYTYQNQVYDPKLSYLEFPLLLKIKIPIGESIYPYAFIGESVGFKVGENTNLIENTGISQPIADQFKGVNLTTIYGAGIDLESEFAVFSVDLRYGNGMINILNDGNGESGYFSMTVGLGFDLSKND